MDRIIIPARKGSKGLPFKNRKLLKYTLETIPKHLLSITYISTDDEQIKEQVNNICQIHNRSLQNSQDSTSTLSLIKEIRQDLCLTSDENVVMLYLTYPERTFEEISRIYDFFVKNNINSLLCKKEIKTSPFLHMYDLGNGKGKQVIKHNLYRRQDYPKCFEISHYVSIFKVSEIDKMNNNMYNDETYFYEIKDRVDVDEQKDLERFLKNDKN